MNISSPSLNADMRDRYLTVLGQFLDGTLIKDPPLRWYEEQYDPKLRESGWDWPSVALTMIGSKRLANIRLVLESVIGEGVEGDFVETGVWRGGASIYAKAVLLAYGCTDRKVICCDSFEGLPEPDAAQYPKDEGSEFHIYPELAVSLEEVRDNFASLDLLDDNVEFIKGWFRDTMVKVPSEKIAVLRLDGDMYESTIDPLVHLYDRIPTGGWVIVDDYNVVPACKDAVHDFLGSRDETPDIREIDGVGVYFRKNETEFLSNKSLPDPM